MATEQPHHPRPQLSVSPMSAIPNGRLPIGKIKSSGQILGLSIPAARTTSPTKGLFIIMGPACRHLQEASQEVGDLVGRPCHNKSNHSLSSISSHLPISCSRCFSLMIDSITALRVSTLVIFFTFRPLHSPSWVALYVHFVFFFTLVLLAFHPLEPGIFTVFILVCYNILHQGSA